MSQSRRARPRARARLRVWDVALSSVFVLVLLVATGVSVLVGLYLPMAAGGCGAGCSPAQMQVGYVVATALPVVAGREGGMPEAVVDGQTGLLADPYNPASIAESIQRILRSPELGARLGAEGRRVAERKYSWQRVARDLRVIADAHALERRR